MMSVTIVKSLHLFPSMPSNSFHTFTRTNFGSTESNLEEHGRFEEPSMEDVSKRNAIFQCTQKKMSTKKTCCCLAIVCGHILCFLIHFRFVCWKGRARSPIWKKAGKRWKKTGLALREWAIQAIHDSDGHEASLIPGPTRKISIFVCVFFVERFPSSFVCLKCCFTDSTMVTHHFSPPFKGKVFLFPTTFAFFQPPLQI